MTTSPLTPGQNVTWFYVPRGGYGWPIPVRAKVIKVNAKTVTIQVWHHATGKPLRRHVRPDSLASR